MPRKHTPTPDNPAPGITRWRETQWRVAAEVGTRANRLTSRKVYDTLDLRAMVRWQEAERTRLRATLEANAEVARVKPKGYVPVTLDEAAAVYLPTVKKVPSRKFDMNGWLQYRPHGTGPRFGTTRLADLDTLTLKLAWEEFITLYTGSTLNKRRTALLGCLELHDDQHGTTLRQMAAKAIPFKREKAGLPLELDYTLIYKVLAAIPQNSGARAMLAVMAETGLPPETLRRLQPTDVREDDVRPTMRLPVRQKGATVDAVTLPINKLAVVAFRAYRAMNAWGGVNKATLSYSWQVACAAVRRGAYAPQHPRCFRGVLGPPEPGLPHCTPYVLRHSFACRALDENHGDLNALKYLLQHKSIEQTDRYARGREARAAMATIDAMNRRLSESDPSHDPSH